MPTYQKLLDSIKDLNQHRNETVKLINDIEAITERPLLIYVADQNKPHSSINLEDKTGFSDLIQDINVKAVDILINSPGGSAEVTESIVNMLRSKFNHIRFIVPNYAKSAATLMCLSGNKILMDHRGELGPIDPQILYNTSEGPRYEAVENILDGFNEAKNTIKNEGAAAATAYVPLLNKLTIGFLHGCKQAKELSSVLAKEWLKKYMFNGKKGLKKHNSIVKKLFRSQTFSHGRAICVDKCIKIGLDIEDLRQQKHKELREKIWTLWCLYGLFFDKTPVFKIYENSKGCHIFRQIQTKNSASNNPT